MQVQSFLKRFSPYGHGDHGYAVMPCNRRSLASMWLHKRLDIVQRLVARRELVRVVFLINKMLRFFVVFKWHFPCLPHYYSYLKNRLRRCIQLFQMHVFEIVIIILLREWSIWKLHAKIGSPSHSTFIKKRLLSTMNGLEPWAQISWNIGVMRPSRSEHLGSRREGNCQTRAYDRHFLQAPLPSCAFVSAGVKN